MMKRAVLVEPRKIRFEEYPIPVPHDDEVLVKVKVCGICGSDVHVYKGRHPIVSPPLVQGHEFSGTAEKVGSKVSGVQLRERVVVEPTIPCGTCYNCVHGRPNICSNLKFIGGIGHDGALSEFVVVPKDCVLPLPDEISFQEGAVVEPTAVAVHSVRLAEQKQGDRVFVFGAGTIGLLTMQAARSAGAREIIATDLLDYRLSKAKQLGADKTINSRSEKVSDVVRREYGRDGIDTIYDCVGTEETVGEALRMARRGTNIMLIGVPEQALTLDLVNLQDRELQLRGSLMYVRSDYLKAIELIREKDISVEPIITHHFSLAEVPKAYEILTKGVEEAIKVQIHVSSS